MTANVPNAFVQTNIPLDGKKIIMKIRGQLVDILLELFPGVYDEYVIYGTGVLDSDSDDDFICEGSNSSFQMIEGSELCNTMVISGPCGAGKTAAVYACAAELGYTVLELNSGDLRTGRNIMSTLAEASQSHQVSYKSAEFEAGDPQTATAVVEAAKPKKPVNSTAFGARAPT